MMFEFGFSILNLRTPWKWLAACTGALIVLAASLSFAQSTTGQGRPPASGVARLIGAVNGAESFVPVEVYVDAGGSELGAYQFEVTAKDAIITGLEGGESKAFSAAPYYDPAAMAGNRIVVASFSTDETLPKGLTRVARLHMMVPAGAVGADGLPAMASKLVVATDGQGKTVNAKLMLKPVQGDM